MWPAVSDTGIRGRGEDMRSAGHDLQRSLLSEKLADAVELTGYHDCLFAFRSDMFESVLNPGEELFAAGTAARIDGTEHADRRNVLNRLTKRDGHQWFRDRALGPTIPRVLAWSAENRGADGVVRTDLVVMARRIQVQLGAGIVGLQDVEDLQRSDTLIQIMNDIAGAISLQYLRGDRSHILPRALAAKERFREEFYEPSRAHHERLVSQHEAGELAESELPRDLLTLLVLGADPRWADPEIALREAMITIFGSVETSTMALTLAFDELETWFESHPEDRPLESDPSFLGDAIRESLRLHPAAPSQFRRAREAVELPSGVTVSAGDLIALRGPLANRDVSVYGPDAHVFDPRRQVEAGIYRYGLTFGSGQHLCFGMPFVLTGQGYDGALVQLMSALYAWGARRDPDSPARRHPDLERETFELYPITLTPPSR
jgi:cytochrome P450